MEKWQVGEGYQVIREIGRGSFAMVAEAEERATGKKVAIKKFWGACTHPNLSKQCLREVEILSKAHHPNILSLRNVSATESSVYMVVDLLPYDLRSVIRSGTFLEPIQIKKTVYDLLLALTYLHSAGIVHRDLKPGNILITQECNVRICDFGQARSLVGLKSHIYDIDKQYREEYNKNYFAAFSSSESSDCEDEDLDEHAKANPQIYLKGKFEVRRKDKGKRESGPIIIQKAEARPLTLPRAATDEESKQKMKKPSHSAKQQVVDFGKIMKENTKLSSLKGNERELTSHVTSRWYRAPEVILLEKVYFSAMDIWSLGCVFGELLHTLEGSKIPETERTALFPGSSCFPLSPSHGKGREVCEDEIEEGDQLTKICEILGTPQKEDLAFLNCFSSKQHTKLLPQLPGKRFEEIFPGADDLAIDLIKKMLSFNPFSRITAYAALNHPYFEQIRRKDLEQESDIMHLNQFAKPTEQLAALVKSLKVTL